MQYARTRWRSLFVSLRAYAIRPYTLAFIVCVVGGVCNTPVHVGIHRWSLVVGRSSFIVHRSSFIVHHSSFIVHMKNRYSTTWFELFLQPIQPVQTEREIAFVA